MAKCPKQANPLFKCHLQELRQEIALAALEVGNNREVARLYSERLGYTVNESTVRGIKKRYLEVTQSIFLLSSN